MHVIDDTFVRVHGDVVLRAGNVTIVEQSITQITRSGPLVDKGGGGFGAAYENRNQVPWRRHAVLNLGEEVGKSVEVYAVSMGATNFGDGMMPLWDCGLPSFKTVVTSNFVFSVAEIEAQRIAKERETASKVIAFQLKLASNGTAYAQYELGVRYAKGDGVESNRALAEHWLGSACTNGHAQASNALVTLRGH